MQEKFWPYWYCVPTLDWIGHLALSRGRERCEPLRNSVFEDKCTHVQCDGVTSVDISHLPQIHPVRSWHSRCHFLGSSSLLFGYCCKCTMLRQHSASPSSLVLVLPVHMGSTNPVVENKRYGIDRRRHRGYNLPIPVYIYFFVA